MICFLRPRVTKEKKEMGNSEKLHSFRKKKFSIFFLRIVFENVHGYFLKEKIITEISKIPTLGHTKIIYVRWSKMVWFQRNIS